MNCKPGDLAIVIVDSPAKGCIVEVISMLSVNPLCWECRSARPIPGTNRVGKIFPTLTGYAGDDELMPIAGPRFADETEREKELTA